MVQKVPYTRSDGFSSSATITPVQSSLEHLDDAQVRVVYHLAQAMNALTPIYAEQLHPQAKGFLRAVQAMEQAATGAERERFANHAELLCAMHNPFDHITGAGYLLDAPALEPEFGHLFARGSHRGPRANLYPADMTDDEFEALDGKGIENSTVVRHRDGSLRVLLNEERFAPELAPAISHLEQAIAYAEDPALVAYLTAKAAELRDGGQQSRVASDIAWIANNGPIDFTLSTALETYIDEYRGIRACAQGGVFVRNARYESIARDISDLIPSWRGEVPWDTSKDGVSDIPQLRFVDVVRWAGGYDLFPKYVLAEALPNDLEVAERYGRVNLVFVNVLEAGAKHGTQSQEVREFLHPEALPLVDAMTAVHTTMVAAHELGHSVGPVIPEENWKREFGHDGHILEEARAELFSMWALPRLAQAGIIRQEEILAGHYDMLLTCINALKSTPKNHNGSRNIMFHYFLQHGGIRAVGEGNQVYQVVPGAIDRVVEDLLGQLGTLKAHEDARGFQELKETYCSMDLKEQIERRFSHISVGKMLVFPEISLNKGRAQLSHPPTFRGQSRSLSNYV